MKKPCLKKAGILPFIAVMLFFASCINGYHDDWELTSDVKGVTLESPDAAKVTFSKNTENVLTIQWGVVYGAIGYELSVIDITDVNNPVNIIDKKVVDGCFDRCTVAEDTNYKIVLRALGNPKYDNKDAVASTEVPYSTMIPAIVIPNGTDLYEWFAANPITQSDEEQAYELEAGGSYSVSGELNFGDNWIILRGNKADRPTLTYGLDGRLVASAKGFSLKFINLDLSAIPANANSAVILLDAASTGTIPNPIVLQSCNINGVEGRILYNNGKTYTVSDFLIKDCVIEWLSTNRPAIDVQQGFVDHLTISNSTIYGLRNSENYFIRYQNGQRGSASFVKFANSTFYNICKGGQMANYSGMSVKTFTLTLDQNIFFDCGNQNVVRRLCVSSNNPVKIIKNNCYWFNGAFPQAGEIDQSNGESSVTATNNAANVLERGFGEEPGFANPATGDFTVAASATEILRLHVGDPRWLP
ncbi:MAG: DUF4957 domain-containing protein [Paludibacter sp.]|jgi:hypothetical protein|nr:DUF4957 domain-containing protein [Paludibacter sp.]